LLRDHPGAPRDEQLRLITEYNVLAQLENLRGHPAVEAALAKGQLEVQGWVYDIGSGLMRVADPQSGVFHPLTPSAESL
jgi:carbonic anhydrase